MSVELVGVAAGYGVKTVLSDVSLAVQPGEVLALLGHNGAGKTTTLKTVMGLLALRAGEVRFDGRSLGRMAVAERAALGIRLLPEGQGIFPDLTVAENLEVVAARNAARGALFTIDYLYGLFPVLAERRAARAGSMSGGQQKMLALGLALLGTPRCLMLDEPSIGLAPNLVERLFAEVRALCRANGVATILAEQNVAAAMQLADRVVIMNNGRVVFDGLPSAARESNVWQYF